MRILCVFGKHNYGDPKRGAGYEYTNFLPSLQHLGHEVFFFESFNRDGYQSFAELNKTFLRTVIEKKPDLIFCVLMGYEIWIETFEFIKKHTRSILINWATDDSWKYNEFSRLVAPHFHLYATTYPQAVIKSLRRGYKNVVLTQWAANGAKLLSPIPAVDCKWDVTFIGMAYGDRPKWISALKRKGIKVVCFGYGWKNGPVDADIIPSIIRASRICLNFSDSNWVIGGWRPVKSRQMKARVFEVPGYGGFLMTQPSDTIEHFYKPDKEIVLFQELSDLVEKIRYYLHHPDKRDAIALAAHQKTRIAHTYDDRFSDLLRQSAEVRQSIQIRPSDTGFLPRMNWILFDKIAQQHNTTPFLETIKKLLLKPCVAVWGKERGHRAARRILFELSWRIAGKKTYSASGWPGRLFYKES